MHLYDVCMYVRTILRRSDTRDWRRSADRRLYTISSSLICLFDPRLESLNYVKRKIIKIQLLLGFKFLWFFFL